MAKWSKLEYQARSRIGKNWSKSSITRNELLQNVHKICEFMKHQGLNDITHMKSKHVDKYMESVAHLSEGRMANHATALREIAKSIGKARIVKSNAEYGCVRNAQNRTKYKDINLNEQKFQEVKRNLAENHRIAYEMSRNFGLRQKESLLSHKVVERQGKEYLVVEGAKGNRYREIEIVNEKQRETIERNISYRETHHEKLIDSARNLKEGMRDYQNDLSRAGATRESLANTHSCRREYIIGRCEEIRQLADLQQREEALEKLVEEIGHGRSEVIACYASV